MPQTFQVVKCYKCSAFQAHITCKSNKWDCRICGEKQSVKRHYGLGTAKECRFQVQTLNAMRGQLEGAMDNTDQDSDSSREAEEIETEPVKDNNEPVKNSKWSKYIDEMETVEASTNSNETLGGAEVVLELPPKRRKINNTNNNKTSSTLSSGDHEKIEDNDEVPPVLPVALVNVVNTKVYHPEETFNKVSLDNNKLVPSVNNKNSKWAQFTEPDLTSQTSLLEPFENLDGMCSDSMMSKPFTWGDETTTRDDLESILGI